MKTTSPKSVVLIGAGGHARVLIAALKRIGIVPRGCLDRDREKWTTSLLGVPILGDDEVLTTLGGSTEIELVNSIGFVGDARPRRGAWERFHTQYRFAEVCDPTAFIDDTVGRFGEGVQVLARAIIQTGVVIGDNSIVNTGAQVDHDCRIGSHCHISPGAILCGDVTVGDSVLIGAGATVKQGLNIGDGAKIGMGAVVIHDVERLTTVVGNPARPLS